MARHRFADRDRLARPRRARRHEMTAAECRKLPRLFVALMDRLDAAQLGSLDGRSSVDWLEFDVRTTLGPLTLSMFPAPGRGPFGSSVFGRFADARRAAAYFDPGRPLPDGPMQGRGFHVNPYTGKWNHHFGRTTAREAISQLECELVPIVDSLGE